MSEVLSESFINTDSDFANWILNIFPPELHERLFIEWQKFDMLSRNPGKYDKRLRILHTLANTNPFARLYPSSKPWADGLFPAVEVVYHFGRFVDNVADGDVKVPHLTLSVTEWLDSLIELVPSEAAFVKKAPTIEFMLQRVFFRLNTSGNLSGVDLHTEIIAFLEAMKAEHSRRENNTVLTKEELWSLHDNSFRPPHTITLAALRSAASGEDLPGLGIAQGILQGFRDWREDIELGICNIPLEVLLENRLTFQNLLANPDLFLQTPGLLVWALEAIQESMEILEDLSNRSASLDKMARYYVKYFVKENMKRAEELTTLFSSNLAKIREA